MLRCWKLSYGVHTMTKLMGFKQSGAVDARYALETHIFDDSSRFWFPVTKRSKESNNGFLKDVQTLTAFAYHTKPRKRRLAARCHFRRLCLVLKSFDVHCDNETAETTYIILLQNPNLLVRIDYIFLTYPHLELQDTRNKLALHLSDTF